MNGRRVVVATPGHCFDGMCSAALFTHLLEQVEPGAHSFRYHGAGYGRVRTASTKNCSLAT